MVAQYCAQYVTKETNVKHCCYVALTFDHPQTGSSCRRQAVTESAR